MLYRFVGRGQRPGVIQRTGVEPIPSETGPKHPSPKLLIGGTSRPNKVDLSTREEPGRARC